MAEEEAVDVDGKSSRRLVADEALSLILVSSRTYGSLYTGYYYPCCVRREGRNYKGSAARRSNDTESLYKDRVCMLASVLHAASPLAPRARRPLARASGANSRYDTGPN